MLNSCWFKKGNNIHTCTVRYTGQPPKFHLEFSLWTLLNPCLDVGQVLHCLLQGSDLRELVHRITKPSKANRSTDQQS